MAKDTLPTLSPAGETALDGLKIFTVSGQCNTYTDEEGNNITQKTVNRKDGKLEVETTVNGKLYNP